MKTSEELTPEKRIVGIVRRHYPTAQAIYLFGSFGTPGERPESDVDIAVLLPAAEKVSTTSMMLSDCRFELEDELKRDVDLLSARDISTVFQKEVVFGGRRLDCQDENAMAEFECLTMSLYQKLNEERSAILEQFALTGRAYKL